MMIQIGCFALGMFIAALFMVVVDWLFRAPTPPGGVCPGNPTDGGHDYSEHETARNGGVPVCIWCGIEKSATLPIGSLANGMNPKCPSCGTLTNYTYRFHKWLTCWNCGTDYALPKKDKP